MHVYGAVWCCDEGFHVAGVLPRTSRVGAATSSSPATPAHQLPILFIPLPFTAVGTALSPSLHPDPPVSAEACLQQSLASRSSARYGARESGGDRIVCLGVSLMYAVLTLIRESRKRCRRRRQCSSPERREELSACPAPYLWNDRLRWSADRLWYACVSLRFYLKPYKYLDVCSVSPLGRMAMHWGYCASTFVEIYMGPRRMCADDRWPELSRSPSMVKRSAWTASFNRETLFQRGLRRKSSRRWVPEGGRAFEPAFLGFFGARCCSTGRMARTSWGNGRRAVGQDGVSPPPSPPSSSDFKDLQWRAQTPKSGHPLYDM